MQRHLGRTSPPQMEAPVVPELPLDGLTRNTSIRQVSREVAPQAARSDGFRRTFFSADQSLDRAESPRNGIGADWQ
jgi:hypothetical protein